MAGGGEGGEQMKCVFSEGEKKSLPLMSLQMPMTKQGWT